MKGPEPPSSVVEKIEESHYCSLFEYLEDLLEPLELDQRNRFESTLKPLIQFYYARNPDLYQLLDFTDSNVLQMFPRLKKKKKEREREIAVAGAKRSLRRAELKSGDVPETIKREKRVALVRRSALDGSIVYSSLLQQESDEDDDEELGHLRLGR